ncbi:MAG TPA: hypothetical protein VF765_14730 [Polyangiaceae bacterium]
MRPSRRAALLTTGLHIATLAYPAIARAQTTQAPPVRTVGSDIIYTKSGGMMRGTLIEVATGAQATIQLGTGEVVTVPWAEISRIEQGAPTPAPSPTPSPTPAPAPTPAPGPPDAMVVVHIDSPSPVELQVTHGQKNDWQTVCASPCDQSFPAHGTYRIAGGGVRPSSTFTLSAMHGRANLVASPSSTGWFVGGIVLLAVGGGVMLVGAFIGFIAEITATVDKSGTSTNIESTGWTMAGVGAIGLIAGIIAMASNAHTGLEMHDATPAPAPAPQPAATWRNAPAFETALPRPVTVPILGGTF